MIRIENTTGIVQDTKISIDGKEVIREMRIEEIFINIKAKNGLCEVYFKCHASIDINTKHVLFNETQMAENEIERIS